MTKKVIGVLFGSVLACSVAAQQVTVSADAAGVSSVWTLVGSSSSGASIPTGPLAQGTIAAVGGSPAAASAYWAASVPNQVAPVAFTVRARASTSWTSQAAFGSSLLTLDIHLDNGGVAPLRGVLALRKALVQLTGSATATVDVGADGTVELSGATIQRSVAVDAPGGSIDVRVVVQAVAGSFIGPTDSQIGEASVYGEFFPGQTLVERFATFGTVIAFDARPIGADRWQLRTSTLPTLGLQPFATVFGLQPTNLPIANGLTQLVSLDSWLPGTALEFDLPPLPPGFALYAQAVMIAPDGSLLSSNSLRALWF